MWTVAHSSSLTDQVVWQIGSQSILRAFRVYLHLYVNAWQRYPAAVRSKKTLVTSILVLSVASWSVAPSTELTETPRHVTLRQLSWGSDITWHVWCVTQTVAGTEVKDARGWVYLKKTFRLLLSLLGSAGGWFSVLTLRLSVSLFVPSWLSPLCLCLNFFWE